MPNDKDDLSARSRTSTPIGVGDIASATTVDPPSSRPTHTPGPWRAQFAESGGYDCMTDAWQIGAFIGGGWPAPIATVDLSHYGQSARNRTTLPEMSRAKAEADARLIAAAPELLVALRNVVALLDEDGAVLDEACDIARAAIAKVEGR